MSNEPISNEEQKPAIGWHWSEDYLRHDTGPGHVENPHSYQVLGEALTKTAKALDTTFIPNRKVTQEELLRCHPQEYLDLVHADVNSSATQLRTGDTEICPASEEVAMLGAGAGLSAIEAVLENKVQRAFVAVRPPGHHATADRGMGFCLYNNVALMARHAQESFGIERVLIVDWDVHHGNGTQDIFYSDESVFFFSTHQEGIYPHSGAREETGAGKGEGAIMNFPLPAGSGIDQFLKIFNLSLVPAMEEFQPELVLISAGFDASVNDLLGDLRLTSEDFATLTRIVVDIANRWAQGRVVSILEGGYHPDDLAACGSAHLKALADK